jgi:hypothetical protein
MFGKTEEERAAEQARKQAEETERRRAAEAAEQQRRAAEFARSPVGQATAAREGGQRLFQVLLPLAELGGDDSYFGSADNRLQTSTTQTTVLDEIEKVGWRLEHAHAVFAETGATSSARMLSSGEGTVTRGTVYGLYVFRAL